MNTQQDDNQVDPLDEIQQKIKAQEDLNAEVQNISETDTEIAELTRIAKQAMADLANFRRRSEEEKKQFVQFANANLILDLLKIIDTFDRSLKSMPEELKENEWVKGVQGIDQQLHSIMDKQGLTRIATVGEKLNVASHEALMQAPGEKNIILEEFEAGYMLGDRVLRPAKVKVGNGESQS